MSLHVKANILEFEKHYLDVSTDLLRGKGDIIDIKSYNYQSEPDFVTCKSYTSNDFVIVDVRMRFAEPKTDIFQISGEHIMLDFVFDGEVKNVSANPQDGIDANNNTHNINYRKYLAGNFEISANSEMGFMSFILTKKFYLALLKDFPELDIEFFKRKDALFPGQLSEAYIPLDFEIQMVLEQIRKASLSSKLMGRYLKAKIQELLFLQIESYNRQFQLKAETFLSQEDISKLHLAKQIIESNYVDAPSIKDLCRIVGLNEFKIKKGFKILFQTTIKSYIIHLRMNYAEKLLTEGDYLVFDIALKCGYNSLENFYTAFKKFYGCSPRKKFGYNCCPVTTNVV